MKLAFLVLVAFILIENVLSSGLCVKNTNGKA